MSHLLDELYVAHGSPSGVCAGGGDIFEGAGGSLLDSPEVSMAELDSIAFAVITSENAGGDSVITAWASSDSAATTTSAISFDVCEIVVVGTTYGATRGSWSCDLRAYTTSTKLNTIYWVEVAASKLPSSGYEYVKIRATENTDAAAGGAILIVGKGSRYRVPGEQMG